MVVYEVPLQPGINLGSCVFILPPAHGLKLKHPYQTGTTYVFRTKVF